MDQNSVRFNTKKNALLNLIANYLKIQNEYKLKVLPDEKVITNEYVYDILGNEWTRLSNIKLKNLNNVFGNYISYEIILYCPSINGLWQYPSLEKFFTNTKISVNTYFSTSKKMEILELFNEYKTKHKKETNIKFKE